MSIPDPLKLHILKGMTAALKEITVANDYKVDLSDLPAGSDGVVVPRVYRGRAWFGDTDPLPMVSILEGVSDEVAEPAQQTPTGEYLWPINVQGFVKDDPLNPTDPAYVLLADVRRRLAIEMKRKTTLHDADVFGLGLKSRLTIHQIGFGVVRPADDLSSHAYFWLTVILRVVDNPATPYA